MLEELIEIAIKSGSDFCPISCYQDEDFANGVCESLEEQYIDNEDVHFDVRAEGNKYFVGITAPKKAQCGGDLDKYCPVCKCTHFDKENLNSAELTRKKAQYYKEWYERNRKCFRDKIQTET